MILKEAILVVKIELKNFKNLQFKKVKVINMSSYYSIFLQVKVDENTTIKEYLLLEKKIKSQLKNSNKLIRFIDIELL